PSLVAPPNDFSLGAATCFRNDQADFAAQGKIGTNDSHTTGVAYIYGNPVCAASTVVFIPFDLKAKAGDGALVGAELRPAIFNLLRGAGHRIQSSGRHE